MSFSSIDVNLPDPFSMFPMANQFPISSVGRVPPSQYFVDNATLVGSNITAPIVVNKAGAVLLTLPSAVAMFTSLGGLVDVNGLVVSNNKIQLNDVFLIPIVNAGSGDVTTDQTGLEAVTASASGVLIIRWTTVTVGAAPVFAAKLA